MKYRLADLNNGPFGDVYETLADAEKALAEEIAEGQAFNDEYAQECADAGCAVPRAADFFSIVEVESVRAIAIEDNAGGLHIALLDGDVCKHFFSGFEFGGDRAPTMQEELQSAVEEGVRGWDGDAEDPQAAYDDITASEYGYKVIGQWECGELEIYPEVMGNAGHRWSHTSYDD